MREWFKQLKTTWRRTDSGTLELHLSRTLTIDEEDSCLILVYDVANKSFRHHFSLFENYSYDLYIHSCASSIGLCDRGSQMAMYVQKRYEEGFFEDIENHLELYQTD